MQQSTNAQMDDKVAGKINQTVPRTVRSILSEDLNTKAFKKNKKQKSKNTSSVSDGNKETRTECVLPLQCCFSQSFR